MKNAALIFVLILSLGLCWPAYADTEPVDDAEHIASLLFNDDVVEITFGAMGELMGLAMVGEFQNQGVEVSPEASAVISAMLLEALIDSAGPPMRSLYADAYRRQYSEDELAAYRAFLDTTAGQRIVNGNSAFLRDIAKRAEAVGMTLGVEAAQRMLENIQAGVFPEGTETGVRKEIEKIYESK